MLFHPSGQGFGRISDAGHLSPVDGGRDQERRQPAINTHPAGVVGDIAGPVLVVGVQVSGLDIQRHPPPTTAMADGGETDLGPLFGEHAA